MRRSGTRGVGINGAQTYRQKREKRKEEAMDKHEQAKIF